MTDYLFATEEFNVISNAGCLNRSIILWKKQLIQNHFPILLSYDINYVFISYQYEYYKWYIYISFPNTLPMFLSYTYTNTKFVMLQVDYNPRICKMDTCASIHVGAADRYSRVRLVMKYIWWHVTSKHIGANIVVVTIVTGIADLIGKKRQCWDKGTG